MDGWMYGEAGEGFTIEILDIRFPKLDMEYLLYKSV